jgi:RNA polymerase sigma factor (sigma-70 family)
MAATQFRKVVQRLQDVVASQGAAVLTDADLWERYVQGRDEAAFESLVRRHGPIVLGVCRRILCNEQDAEDAFQATFLVLIRRAGSLQSPSSIANWLHGVAYRTALEARSAGTRRRAREATIQLRSSTCEDPWVELWPVLDQELARLAEKYRAAVILCDLDGKSRKEAALQLGWPEGTVASRLARGRSILAKRLARRGFTGSLMALAVSNSAASARVPAELVASTVTTARVSATEGAALQALLSAKVIALTEGVLKSMFLTKIKTAVTVLLVLGIAALGLHSTRTVATEPAGGMPDAQEQCQTNPDELQKRVLELKKELQQLHKKIANLEQENQPKRDERNTGDASPHNLFKHRVTFEAGYTESNEGGRIEIREVWGTRPKIEVGGQYLVRGKYVLPKGERGKLYFYETAEGASNQTTATLDLQATVVDKQEGEFTLVHGMAGPGYFHLYLADPERYSRYFANVYFGTGDNVLRRKP